MIDDELKELVADFNKLSLKEQKTIIRMLLTNMLGNPDLPKEYVNKLLVAFEVTR